MDETLLNPLLKAGLHEKEAKVYLALLGLGGAPVTDLAKKAGLKRSIVYVVLDDLIKHGYVSELPGKKVRHFVATDPSKFIQKLQTSLEDIKLILPVFRALQRHGGGRPKIEIFEGRQGVLDTYRLFEYGKELRYLSHAKRLLEYFPKEVERWRTATLAGTIATKGQKLILVDTPEDRAYGHAIQKRAGQQVRLLPKGLTIDMDLAIADDKIGITSFEPLYIVLVRSQPIANSLNTLFDIAWKQCRPLR